MKYIFIFLILYGCSPKSNIFIQDNCELLTSIFKEEHVAGHISDFKNNNLIRVIDLSNHFGKIKCGYERYYVRVEDKVMIDINSGRFIDIIILSMQEKRGFIEVELFYSKRTDECQRDFLMKGTLIFERSNNILKLKESKFGSID